MIRYIQAKEHFSCYSQTHIKTKNGMLSIVTEKYQVKLSKKILLTFDLLPTNYACVYHNQMCEIDNGYYVPIDRKIAGLNMSPTTQTNTISRDIRVCHFPLFVSDYLSQCLIWSPIISGYPKYILFSQFFLSHCNIRNIIK